MNHRRRSAPRPHLVGRRTWTAVAVSSLLVAAATTPVGAAAIPDVPGLPEAAATVMTRPPYAHAGWVLRVVDARTGEVLVDDNGDLMVEPASVTKTYSSAAAWVRFGPDHRIVTPVVRTGPVRSGVLRGDLVLVAKGDITMGGQTGPDGRVVFTDLDHNDANALPGATIASNDPLAGLDSLARQVRSAGIRNVAGDVVVDDRLFVTQDLGNDGPVSPIVVNNNLIDVLATPTTPGRPAAVMLRPAVAPWHVRNLLRTTPKGSVSAVTVTHDAATGRITVSGTIADDSAPVLRVVHVPDPARFARTAFVEALRRAGVTASKPAVGANRATRLPSAAALSRAPQVGRLVGLPLSENVRYILKVSYNRGAQTLVCLLAVASGSRVCDEGLAAMAPTLARLGVAPGQVSLVDGSGLPGNVVTATSQTQLQRAFAQRPDAARWRDTLPVMGVDGSIATVQTGSPAAGNVAAKTGTNVTYDLVNMRYRLMTKALGGYITARSGRELAFALVVTNAMLPDLDGVFAVNEDLGEIASALWAAY